MSDRQRGRRSGIERSPEQRQAISLDAGQSLAGGDYRRVYLLRGGRGSFLQILGPLVEDLVGQIETLLLGHRARRLVELERGKLCACHGRGR